MNHQKYEEWLLSDNLNNEQSDALQSHLQTCAECSRIAFGWHRVITEIKSIPDAVPAPQFKFRWESRMAEQRLRQQRRLTWITFFVFIVGATAAALTWAITQNNGVPSLIDLLFRLMSSVTFFLDRANTAQNFLYEFFDSLPLIVPVILWIAVTMSLLFWIILWALSVWRLPHLVKISKNANPSHEFRN